MKAASLSPLLAPADVAPVEVVHSESDVPLLLLCEHAGLEVPAALGTLGIDEAVLNSHRGWDIGAEDVARRLTDLLRAPLILQRYSRLVIDANRPPGSQSSIPEISDGETIHGNRNLTAEDRQARRLAIFDPMDRAIAGVFSAQRRCAAFSIHSFTPHFNGKQRPWHAGFITRRSMDTANQMRAFLSCASPNLNIAVNEPYRIGDDSDWFIPVHAEARGLPHCLIEIRNDQIDHAGGAAHWAGLLANAIKDVVGELT